MMMQTNRARGIISATAGMAAVALLSGCDIKNELLQNTRQEFFAAYMSKAKAKMKITINEATVRALIGG